MRRSNHIGVDLVEVGRIEAAVASWGDRFLHRVYTKPELRLCRGRGFALAGRFAAKEAVMKALGTGFDGVGWREIEVVANRRGQPVVRLSGRAKKRAAVLGIHELVVSLSHSREHAIAYAHAC